MTLKPPRAGEILAASFGGLLLVSLFLPWYRREDAGCAPGAPGCERDTVSAFGAFSALDVVLVVVGLGAIGLLVLEVTQRTAAVPVAWSALLAPLGALAFVLVLWRTLAPPAGDQEPLFAFLGLAACAGIAVACVVSMRNARPAVRGVGARRRLPEPLPVPEPEPGGSTERA